MWEHSNEYMHKCKNICSTQDKFAKYPVTIKGFCGSFADNFPIISSQVNLKALKLDLVELFDMKNNMKNNMNWYVFREYGNGFVFDSVLVPFLSYASQSYNLQQGDEISFCLVVANFRVVSSSIIKYFLIYALLSPTPR